MPTAVMIVQGGRVIYEWGDVSKRVKVSSVRKSFLSALYGIYVQEGIIDLDKTLYQVGIDDVPPLSPTEKQATIRMLLQSRSGVYYSFVGGSPDMRAEMPTRGSHAPGTFWYYNNWDFNALGGIFERLTGTKIGAAFTSALLSRLRCKISEPRMSTMLSRSVMSPSFQRIRFA